MLMTMAHLLKLGICPPNTGADAAAIRPARAFGNT
jgi:hypothetical protein